MSKRPSSVEIVSPRKGLGFRYVTLFPNGAMESSVHDKVPHWKEIQEYVLGPFQLLPHFTKLDYHGRQLTRGVAYANKEGHARGMAYNKQATEAWMRSYLGSSPDLKLVGPILFVARDKEPDDGQGS